MFVLENPSGTESLNEKYLRQSQARSYAALNIHRRRRAGQKDIPWVTSRSTKITYDPNQPTFATRPAPDFKSRRIAQRQHPFESVYRPLQPHSNAPDPTPAATVLEPTNPSTTPEQSAPKHTHSSENALLTLTVPPAITKLVNTSPEESRSLAFFRDKTALEWPAWHDAEFWRILAPQACYAYPSVKHAIASIGAYHEGLTTDIDDADAFDRHRELSFSQSKKALACLSRDYDSMPISAILVAYTAIAAASTYMHDSLYWQAVYMQCNIIDSVRADECHLSQSERTYITHYLEPIIERQRAKAGQYIDLIHCLKLTPASHFYVANSITVPDSFQSLYHAESLLESILNYTTYTTKLLNLPALIIPRDSEDLYNSWIHALDLLRSTHPPHTSEHISASILRSCANLGMMMIKTMHSTESDESIFDNFSKCFVELRDTNRSLLSLFNPLPGREQAKFGIDVSWITLVGNAASRWCRDPSVRSDLIDMLRMCRRQDAIEAAFIWGEVAYHAKMLEEQGLSVPPESCYDVPLESRVRINLTSFFWTDEKKVQRIQYHFFPYGPEDYHDFLVPHSVGPESDAGDEYGETELMDMSTEYVAEDEMPQMVMGRGYTSWLKPNSRNEYHTIGNPNFFFPISRT